MIAALFFAVAASVAPTPPAVVQSYDLYKSWLAACDNTLTCVAKGLNEGALGAEVELTRAPGGESLWRST